MRSRWCSSVPPSSDWRQRSAAPPERSRTVNMLRRRICTLVAAFGLTALAGSVYPPAAREQLAVVPAGGDLQQAIDRARPGDTIHLQPGVTYTGNFVLPTRSGTQ